MDDFGLDNSTDTNETCGLGIEMETYIHYSLVPSAIIIIILCFFEKRTGVFCTHGKWQRLGSCGGIVIPFDPVNTFSKRWSLGFAFGVTADKLMFLFDKSFVPDYIRGWARVFWVMLIAIEVGFSSYPFFACLSTPAAITGAILGSLYTAAWFVITFMDVVVCPEDFNVLGGNDSLIRYWPSMLCQIFLIGQYILIFVKELRAQSRTQLTINKDQYLVDEHQWKYVQRLMRKPLPQQSQKSWIRRKLYEWDPYFKFPSRMITTAVIIFICLYIFIMVEFQFAKVLSYLLRYIKSMIDQLADDEETEDVIKFLTTIEEFIRVIEGVWIATSVISCLTAISYVFNILVQYRRHIKLLRSGKKDFFFSESSMVSSTLSVVALGKYTACQIAYILWGYLIMHLVQVIFGMVLMYILILPMVHGEWMELVNRWGTAVLTFVLVLIIRKLQSFAAATFFLQPKISPNDKEKPLALDNRKGYMNFSYFLFFHSVVVGLTSCLMRILRGTILGTWLVGRIDCPVMPKGYESWDTGFKTWVGMLLLDHYHTNPILVCFCYILNTKSREKQMETAVTQANIPELLERDSRMSSKARTRWFLAYTLLNNPSLQKYRKPTEITQNSTILTSSGAYGDSLNNPSETLWAK